MRPPITIWRHTTLELFRLVLLTTSILVTAIAFAEGVRWLADGRLGPLDFPKFMFIAMVPMLAYTLPFAACFGATLTYHRMSQDNEITAAHAGGIGHRGVLMPAIISGVILGGSLGALNDYIIPKFLRSMESLIAHDLPKLMVTSINKGEAVQFDDVVINAEQVFENNISADDPTDAQLIQAGVIRHFIFRGFIGLMFDDAGSIEYEATSRVAHLYILPGQRDDGSTGANIARFVLVDMVGYSTEEGRIAAEEFPLPDMEIPNVFEANPKYLTNFELRVLRGNPDRMGYINRQRIDLAYHLGERATTTELSTRLAQTGFVQLRTAGDEIVTIHGSGTRWVHEEQHWAIAPIAGERRIVVDLTPGPDTRLTSTQPLTHIADNATFRTDIGGGPRLRELTIDLFLENVSASRDDGRTPDRKELRYTKLRITGTPEDLRIEDPDRAPEVTPVEELLKRSSAELIAMADQRLNTPEPDVFLRNPYNDLTGSIAYLNREITSKYNERIAMSISCFVMVICGAIVAIRLTDAQPLVVYLWSFFPALFTVITISGGHQMVTKSGLYGLFVLWGGVIALSVYSFVTYRSIARH